MVETKLNPVLKRFYANTNAQFWVLQLVGWFGLSLISFFSLTLWYDQQTDAGYIAHTLLQSAMGIPLSWPLRPLSHYIWKMPFWRRFIYLFTGVVACAAVWAALRLSTFMYMTGEQNLWPDFGGWLFGSILIFVSWSAFYHGIKYYQLLQSEHSTLLTVAAANREEQLKRAQAETFAQEAQLKMLRYQLNPHFLFNTLNAISSLVEGKETPRANRMIVQLSNFLRHSLASDPIKRVTLKEELDALNLYLSIEQARFGDRLEVYFDITSDAEMIKVPSLILQPLVENAIKYAIAPIEEGGKISVHAIKENEHLVLRLTDTGPGIKATKKDIPTHGVGLQNTINRLQTFYGDAYEFSIDDGVEGGTAIYMKIPPEKTTATVVSEVLVGG